MSQEYHNPQCGNFAEKMRECRECYCAHKEPPRIKVHLPLSDGCITSADIKVARGKVEKTPYCYVSTRC